MKQSNKETETEMVENPSTWNFVAPQPPGLSKMLDAMWVLNKEFFPEKMESVIQSAKDYFSPKSSDKPDEIDHKEFHQEYPDDFFEKKLRADYAKYKGTIPLTNIELFRDMEIERLSELISTADIVPRHQRIKADKGFEAFTTAESYVYYLKNIDTSKFLNGSEKSKKSLFSIPTWCAIFHYSIGTKHKPKDGEIKEAILKFMEQHNIGLSYEYFRTEYYKIIGVLYKEEKQSTNIMKSTIKRLYDITSFVEVNYPKALTTIKGDIKHLEKQLADKEDGRGVYQ